MPCDFVILTDSGSDISAANAAKFGIEILPLLYSVDGCDHIPDGQIDMKDFYGHIRSGQKTSTSACNMDDATNMFTKFAKEGKDVLCLSFSSGLSSTYNTCKIASENVSENYPDVKLFVVDSLSASLGLGLLCILASRMRDEGKTIEEVRDYIEETKLHVCHDFTADDLFYLQKGGRVSAATAVVGTMLAIKPVLHVDNEGHLIAVGKARGRKASIAALADKYKENVLCPEKQTVMICHADCIEEAETLADLIRQKAEPKEIIIDYIGPVIGCHSGVGTMSVFYLGKER